MTTEMIPDRSVDIVSPMLKEFLEIWQSQVKDGRLPSRTMFDPLTMPRKLLPHMYMIDITDEFKGKRRRYRWRLLGTNITRKLGRDSTGKFLDETYTGRFLVQMNAFVGYCVDEKRPLRVTGCSDFVEKEWLEYETVYTPLSEDGENVNILMCALVFKQNDKHAHFSSALKPRKTLVLNR